MKKVGIRFLHHIEYEPFESFQYLLDYDFDYFDLEEAIEKGEILELDLEEDKEDRAEDIEVLNELLKEFDKQGIEYELFVFDNGWRREDLKNIS